MLKYRGEVDGKGKYRGEVDGMNYKLKEGLGGEKNVVIGSLDVKALYPSLDVDFTVEVIGEMLHECGISISGVDYEEMGLYLAYSRSREESDTGIKNVCPTRRHNRRPPEMQGSGVKEDKDCRFAPWIAARDEPTEEQKRKMVVESVKVAVSFIMKNHIYNFDNVMHKQARGGPIGLNLTGTTAQVFMLWWDRKFLEKME